MKIWLNVITVACLSGALLNSCGSSDTLQCGDGTMQLDNQCVAVLPADASVVLVTPEGGDSSAVAVFRPSFGGVAAVAPATEQSLLVAWKSATDPLTPQDQLVYRVYVGPSSKMYDTAHPKVTPPGATSMLLTGLQAGAKYFVRVRAVNQSQVEDLNDVEMSAAPAADTVPPTFGGTITASSLDASDPAAASSVKVDWTAATDDQTPAAALVYLVYWSTSASDVRVGGTLGAVSDPGATSLVVAGLPKPSGSYFLRVDARDAAGNSTSNATPANAHTTLDSAAPIFKGCLAPGPASAGGVTLSWPPATDNSTPGLALKYNVYASATSIASDGGGFDFTKKTTFSNGLLSGRVGGLSPNAFWYFICRAVDADGNEDANTAQVSVKTQSDAARPSFGGLVAATLKGNSATLTWLPGTDDQTPGEALRYAVYEGKTDPTQIDTSKPAYPLSAPGASSIVLTKLLPGTIYYWIVRARDEAENEDQNLNDKGVITPNSVCFETDIQPILDKNCALAIMCHGADNPPQGLKMVKGFAYDFLVNVPAVEDQSIDTDGGLGAEGGPHVFLHRKRIQPPDLNQPPPDESFAKQSYLYLKITSDPDIVGSPMPPPPRPALDGASVGLIRNWILQGARRNCN